MEESQETVEKLSFCSCDSDVNKKEEITLEYQHETVNMANKSSELGQTPDDFSKITSMHSNFTNEKAHLTSKEILRGVDIEKSSFQNRCILIEAEIVTKRLRCRQKKKKKKAHLPSKEILREADIEKFSLKDRCILKEAEIVTKERDYDIDKKADIEKSSLQDRCILKEAKIVTKERDCDVDKIEKVILETQQETIDVAPDKDFEMVKMFS